MSNVQYFSNLTTQVDGCQSCAQLQALSTRALTSLNATLSGLTDQIAVLAPLQALTEPPTNPTEVVTWIEDFITGFLTPQLAVTVKLQAQLAELTAATAALVVSITDKAAEFPDCDITPP